MTTGQRRRFSIAPFDLRASAEFAAGMLAKAKVRYALIGRVAVWTWVPAREQLLTKDIDFAVPSMDLPKLRRALAETHTKAVPLRIGGLAVRRGKVRVDFIDRHVDGFGPVFEEAVRAARSANNVADVEGVRLAVVPPEHLIVMKMIPATDKDEDDVVRLLRSRDDLDYRSVRRLVRKHAGAATANRLDHLARKAGRKDAPKTYL